ncbi:unnamed protein product [Prunus armeniaca]|uniref:Uncharacterized protein n=1 Tax=Prunus armeniaca TaxID=36596 RepID=A0A6J5WWQ1_PRUAR|nr:unnamed protein product [Prunus armeniaca]
MKVSQTCEGQNEYEDCGSTACVDAKFYNIESMIYQRDNEDLQIGISKHWGWNYGHEFPNLQFCETFHSGGVVMVGDIVLFVECHSIVDASCHATHTRNWTMEV